MQICAEQDVTFLDYPDYIVNEYGARGIGEIGMAGVAPAITAAVYHATGVRVRELPIRIDEDTFEVEYSPKHDVAGEATIQFLSTKGSKA